MGPRPAGTGAAKALQPHRIALLDEVRQGFPAVPLLLDVKASEPPMDAALVAFVQRFEATDFERIYIKTRNQPLADRLRRLPWPPKTGLTLCERVAFVAFPGLVTAPPGLLDLPLWLVSPALIRRATAAGHLVVVSLVNETQDWHKALAPQGLFGVVTDHPEWRSRDPRDAGAPMAARWGADWPDGALGLSSHPGRGGRPASGLDRP